MDQVKKLTYEQLEKEFYHCQEMIKGLSATNGQLTTEKISLQILLKNKSAELEQLQQQFMAQVELQKN